MDGDALGVSRYPEEPDPIVAFDHARHVVAVGGFGQRGEDLATRHPEAPVDGNGLRGEARGLPGCPPLAERLSVDRAVLDHATPHGGAAPVVFHPLLVTHREVVGDLADQQHGGRVHVEGQRGRPAVPGQFLGYQGVGREVRTQSAVFLRDAQGKEARLAKIGVVLVGKGRIPVDLVGPGRDGRSQRCHPAHQLSPAGGHQVDHVVVSSRIWRVLRSAWNSRA